MDAHEFSKAWGKDPLPCSSRPNWEVVFRLASIDGKPITEGEVTDFVYDIPTSTSTFLDRIKCAWKLLVRPSRFIIYAEWGEVSDDECDLV